MAVSDCSPLEAAGSFESTGSSSAPSSSISHRRGGEPSRYRPAVPEPQQLPDPRFELAFEVRFDVEPAVRVGGASEHEQLHFVPIVGGSVSGPSLSGTVLPGGGDWYVDRDGVAHLDARYVLRTDDGDLVDVRNRGFWRASPEVTARLDDGVDVPENAYYYRTSPVFTTGAEGLRWLTETVFVGMARSENGAICIRFFALA